MKLHDGNSVVAERALFYSMGDQEVAMFHNLLIVPQKPPVSGDWFFKAGGWTEVEGLLVEAVDHELSSASA